MRKTYLFFILNLFVCGTFAQGNLQFNQVVIVSTTDLTVPAGKVWKVESYQQQQVGITGNGTIASCSDLTRSRPYYIDNNPFYCIEGIGYGGSNMVVTAGNPFPFWLKAGQTSRTTCGGDFLSVLEFNIIP